MASDETENEFHAFFKNRNVLVTGGSGFIGTHLIAGLAAAGANVRNLDIRAPHLETQEQFWTPGSYTELERVEDLLRAHRPEIVYNLAAIADLNVGPEALEENCTGLRMLITGCKKQSPQPQLIHFSTQLVVAAGYTPRSDEDFKPYTPYGESKAQTEVLLRQEAIDLRWTIVRPATIWGPHNYVFARGIWKYLKKRYYMLPIGSWERRAYGYVSNLVEQVMRIPIVPPEKVYHEVFYIADETMSGAEWLDAFSVALTGKPVRRVPRSFLWLLAVGGSLSKKLGGPAPIDLGRYERMTTDYPVPTERTFAILGRGSTTFEDGLNASVKWINEITADS